MKNYNHKWIRKQHTACFLNDKDKKECTCVCTIDIKNMYSQATTRTAICHKEVLLLIIFYCGSLLLLVLAVRIYSLVHLLCK